MATVLATPVLATPTTVLIEETNANIVSPPIDTSKPKKEERAYRVGLSYACKRCGLPKKGHVCLVPADGAGAGEAKPVQKKKRPPPTPPAGDSTSEAKKSKTPSTKKSRTDKVTVAPPTDPTDVETSPSATDALALSELIDELREGRPPSLITPDDDGEAAALSVLSTSLNSASWGQPDVAVEASFSPSQFMLGSAPASMVSATRLGSAGLGLRFEAVLSPGTLDALSPLPGIEEGPTMPED